MLIKSDSVGQRAAFAPCDVAIKQLSFGFSKISHHLSIDSLFES